MNLPRGFDVSAAAVLVTGILVSLTGCNSRAQSSVGKLHRPSPPVESVEAIRREDAVAKRARELINEGKYTTTNDARKAAAAEIPYVSDNNESRYQSDLRAYQQQAEVQAKFEADLEKMKRGS